MRDKEFVTLLENYDGEHFFESATQPSGARTRSSISGTAATPAHKLSVSSGAPPGFPGSSSGPLTGSNPGQRAMPTSVLVAAASLKQKGRKSGVS